MSKLFLIFFSATISMMKKYNITCPSGFPEFSPAEERVRQNWLAVIRGVFEKNGFLPVETPLVEREENLLAKGGNPKEMYVLKRVQDDDDTSHSGNALRFDHTVPLALYVARHLNELAFPFRRYSIGPVLRGERAQKGRFRQFDQCDIDMIGSGELSLLNDALVAVVIVQLFEQLNIGEFFVRINNRKILTGFFENLNIKSKDISAVMMIVDDLEKIGATKVLENLVKLGVKKDLAQEILNFTEISGTNEEIFKRLEQIKGGELFTEGVQDLKEVFSALSAMNVPENRVKLDLSIARGLDYYTGTVYETILTGYEGLGSICSGGRYDDLAEVFTGKKLPGVGISIGLTRLLSQLFDAKIIEPERSSPTEVLIITTSPDFMSNALEIGAKIRGMGFCTENYVEDKKLGKQFDYANKLGIPVCVVMGESEVEKGTVQIKNMTSGEQTEVTLEQLEKGLKNILK
ncbi:histidine--tRNA ligase [Candidatus Gracilibacteria bacterium]|nr:histidine--tRNA ligase [Candidatus Gracilibacteria bacterium]